MKSDLEIAREARLEPIQDVAARFGLAAESLELYGPYKAKVDHRLARSLADRPRGRYIAVTAITPTPLGEGKTVTTIGLGLGLNRIGKKAIITLRQPSMGPVFGIKGGAAGGGLSQVLPMEDFNLHLTGDMHAVGAAHNLLAAWADTSVLLKNPFDLNPERVSIRRVVDINDRALRQIEIGLGGPKNGVPRRTGFDITPASEVMAILGLSRDFGDLRQRLGRMIVGEDSQGRPVTAETLECAGAMCAILKKAVDPTVMQTTEGTLAFVHAGPFANIAYGNSSVLADLIAVRLADYTVTESGFGADMGFEKLCSIKSRASGLTPDVAVVVATVRALKAHSGRFKVRPGKPLPEEMLVRDLESLELGMSNLVQQIANVRAHGVPVVCALNRFETDHPDEIELVLEKARAAGAAEAAVSDVHARGGEGGEELAHAVDRVAEAGRAAFQPLYDLELPLEEKIRVLARTIYGADDIDLAEKARESLSRIEDWGFGGLPICMAKTHLSLSHDPKLKGAPKNYVFPVRDVRLSAGAGFVYPLAGDMMLMPGLGSRPALRGIDVDADGNIEGLF